MRKRARIIVQSIFYKSNGRSRHSCEFYKKDAAFISLQLDAISLSALLAV